MQKHIDCRIGKKLSLKRANYINQLTNYFHLSFFRIPGTAAELKERAEIEEQLGTSPPLELRRPPSTSRPITSVPHSLQSPQDRTTGIFTEAPFCCPNIQILLSIDSPQVAQVYMHGPRYPHSQFPDARFFESARASIPPASEPPPAHRNSINAPSPGAYSAVNLPLAVNELPSHMHSKMLEREREQREREQREKERAHPTAIVPTMSNSISRNLSVESPYPGQAKPQDSLLMLLKRHPVMWQGLLALKTDQAAVQMHFVFGSPDIARNSLPCNSDGSTPPLRIAQRMRLEQTQLEGVARKMQVSYQS